MQKKMCTITTKSKNGVTTPGKHRDTVTNMWQVFGEAKVLKKRNSK